ncbi:MAG: ABC transporter permease [Verrucomicrobia bacterium]|nr:ABC transporter permease [Verrucomicrobiota bacterium]
MIGLLLAKDLRRAWRNPLPWVIHLAVPLLITGLIGLTFGRAGDRGGLGRIKLAIVDEDDSALTGFLRGALNQREAGQHIEPFFLKRDEALREISDNRLSAVVIIPRGFAQDYLTGEKRVTLELIKNPAQSFHPAIVEEFLATLTTALNALARNFQAEFPQWRAALERPGGPDFRTIGDLAIRAGDKLQAARPYLFPPLIGYERERRASESSHGPAWNIFAYLLPGMAAMFLLFLADNAVRDLYRELRFRTFERFRTLHHRLFTFIASKVIFAMVILLISAAILFGGGALIFQIRWERPLSMALAVLSYAGFGAGLMALVAAFAGNERTADILNAVFTMLLSLAGGCMFPAEQLPGFLRDHVAPLMPTNWFVVAIRGLQFGGMEEIWTHACLKLGLLGLALMALAAWRFQRRLERGQRG